MTTIGLIRHGSTHWNREGRVQGHTDIPLDEEGLIQANRLAERLSKEHWDEIYSSDLLRATKTAEIIASRMGMSNLRFDVRLREMRCGLIEGTTLNERISKWGERWRDLDLEMELAESVIERGTQCIGEISQKHGDKKILIVSHGALIGNCLKKLVPHVDIAAHLGNTSFTKLIKSDSGWECEMYNCMLHLETVINYRQNDVY